MEHKNKIVIELLIHTNHVFESGVDSEKENYFDPLIKHITNSPFFTSGNRMVDVNVGSEENSNSDVVIEFHVETGMDLNTLNTFKNEYFSPLMEHIITSTFFDKNNIFGGTRIYEDTENCYASAKKNNGVYDENEKIIHTTPDGKTCFLFQEDVDHTFVDRILVEQYLRYYIRIPVEGDEWWDERVKMMEEIIHRSGCNTEKENKKVFFVFDSGIKETFPFVMMSLLYNKESAVFEATKRGLLVIQWISGKHREILSRSI